MTNSSIFIVALLAIFSTSIFDVGQATPRRRLQSSIPSSPQANAEVKKTLSEIKTLLEQVHSLLPKDPNGGGSSSYTSAALQQTLAQLKAVVARNEALITKDIQSSTKSPNARRLFAEVPEKGALDKPKSKSNPDKDDKFSLPPKSSLPKFPHLPKGPDFFGAEAPNLNMPGLVGAKSPNADPDTPSASPSSSPKKEKRSFWKKLFHIGS